MPVRDTNDRWKLVSDRALAVYLRGAESEYERWQRLATPLEDALRAGQIQLEETRTFSPHADIHEVVAALSDRPALVVDDNGYLHGIITAFDLL
ncbi:MAG TPA: CBS domain-containing protein [Longimicrobiales bacterium]